MSMNAEPERIPVAGETGIQTRFWARQPLSAPGKIAFWASVVGGTASLGGNITLILLTGSPNRDSVIILMCWLASAGILATRIRWAPLVSSLLGGLLLYQILGAPYVIEHLSHPNDPNGGPGIFVGDVLVAACGLLVIGGSIVATVRTIYEASR